MLNFPESTVFNKRIPKQKFYDKLPIGSSVEQQFVKEIENVYWTHKLSQETLNVSKGTSVTEIQILQITLKQQSISKNLIELIDREIPYHLVFVVRYADLGQVWISFKEVHKSRQDKFKVDSYYTTDWRKYEELSLEIDGLDLDKIYENFIIQVSGGRLSIDDGTDIKTAVLIAREQDKLKTYIENLEKKVKNEKQFNCQVSLMRQLREVRKRLNNYEG